MQVEVFTRSKISDEAETCVNSIDLSNIDSVYRYKPSLSLSLPTRINSIVYVDRCVYVCLSIYLSLSLFLSLCRVIILMILMSYTSHHHIYRSMYTYILYNYIYIYSALSKIIELDGFQNYFLSLLQCLSKIPANPYIADMIWKNLVGSRHFFF